MRKSEKQLYDIPFFFKKWGTVIIIVGVVVFFVFDTLQRRSNKKRYRDKCHIALNSEVAGVVAKAFFDDNINVKAFVILFTDGRRYINPIFQKSLSGYVEEGDSVFKAPGTFRFLVYKLTKDSQVVAVEDTVDCDK